jgi:hypothetical protein
MPMVRHDAVRKKCDLHPAGGLREEPFEGGVIARIMKKDRAFGRSVQDVKYKSWRSLPASSRHGRLAEAIGVPARDPRSVLYK